MTNLDKDQIFQRLEQLATLSKDLENNAKLQANAANIVAAEQFKKKVTELTEAQSKMMVELVAMHPDPAALERYNQLQQQLDEAQRNVKASKTKSMDELKELEAAVLKGASAYIHHFQTVVAQLMGAPPPSAPVFS